MWASVMSEYYVRMMILFCVGVGQAGVVLRMQGALEEKIRILLYGASGWTGLRHSIKWAESGERYRVDGGKVLLSAFLRISFRPYLAAKPLLLDSRCSPSSAHEREEEGRRGGGGGGGEL
jgi:hypothetical protein